MLSTFILMVFPHLDTNGDGVLDEQELEALFTKEVRRTFQCLRLIDHDSLCLTVMGPLFCLN